MMRGLVVLAFSAVLLMPAAPFATTAQDGDAGPYLGLRPFALIMEGVRFNGQSAPNTPILEAYAGERLRMFVYVPPSAEMHTFHLHGHPWENPDDGKTIDAVRIDPGESHNLEVVAALNDVANSGDWFYHCHVEHHFHMGMWGILRIYPFSVDAVPDARGLDMRVHQMGTDLEGATFTVTNDGQTVAARIVERGDGDYRIDLPLGLSGEVVVTAHHDAGTSVARLRAGLVGYELVRGVFPPAEQMAEVPGLAEWIAALPPEERPSNLRL